LFDDHRDVVKNGRAAGDHLGEVVEAGDGREKIMLVDGHALLQRGLAHQLLQKGRLNRIEADRLLRLVKRRQVAQEFSDHESRPSKRSTSLRRSGPRCFSSTLMKKSRSPASSMQIAMIKLVNR